MSFNTTLDSGFDFSWDKYNLLYFNEFHIDMFKCLAYFILFVLSKIRPI